MRITTHIAYAPKMPAPMPASYPSTAKHARGESAWSHQEDLELKRLWDSGITCREMTRFMPGRNRNAIIGRVHRLGLPKRPSPIKR